jgi:hypothetical protein
LRGRFGDRELKNFPPHLTESRDERTCKIEKTPKCSMKKLENRWLKFGNKDKWIKVERYLGAKELETRVKIQMQYMDMMGRCFEPAGCREKATYSTHQQDANKLLFGVPFDEMLK